MEDGSEKGLWEVQILDSFTVLVFLDDISNFLLSLLVC